MQVTKFVPALISLIALFVCGNFSANAQGLPLEVLASPPIKVKDDIWTIKYSIMNQGTTTARFAIFSCSFWDNWNTDGKDFFVLPGGCRANVLLEEKLDTGKKISGELTVHSTAHLTPGPHRFHLIFIPFNCGASNRKPQKLTPICSNEITAIE
ncbi:MAG: hypothetical protein P4L53_08835 [Candidatus Obscuribacterales bacterium]|nr:hypothetical protein [Candidatus Obscuribacterales bacterium]